MIASAVFSRYARSLADVALETGKEDAVREGVATFSEIFRAVPDVLSALDNPALPRTAKDQLLSDLLSKYPVDRLTANFLRVLLDHARIRYYHDIAEYFEKTLNRRKGIITAQVSSAAPLSDRDRMALQESLARATGRTVHLDVKVDPELLGGLVVQMESTVFDGSVRTQLAEVKQRLTFG